MQDGCLNCTKIADFIKLIYMNGDNEPPCQTALELFADELDISKVFVYGIQQKNCDCYDRCVYSDGTEPFENSETFENTFTTIDNNQVKIVVTKRHADYLWDDKIKSQLSVLTDLIFNFMDRIRLMEIAEKSLYRDVKTNLLNLDGYKLTAQNIIKAGMGAEYFALYINIHKFHTINEIYGYSNGNIILVELSKKISQCLTNGELFARLGGDDFAALIKKDHIDEFLDYISKVYIFAKTMDDDIEVDLSFYGGIYEITSTVENITEIMEKTRAAFKMAKTEHNTNFVYYNEQVQRQISKQKRLEYIMYPALKNKEFLVYYQPKVDLSTYKLIGAEALVRWYNNGEVILPMEFIPIFEKNGFVCEIDFYVLRNVCANIRKWIDEGINPVTVSVNFSKLHLANPRYVSEVMDVIRKNNIDPKYIEIEFTETSYFDNHKTFCEVIDSLKDNGLATSMDDFGTGFSSLNMLKDIPFDMLKLDKSFLEGDDITERERIVIRNVIRMAQELEIKTISEGVETHAQADFLKGIECNMAQGFLFDRPLPLNEFEERLKKGCYPKTSDAI